MKVKKIIAVVNQKGGVGKTTSVVNIASSLAQHNKRVLVVDIDPQANATTGSGINKASIQQSIYELLLGLQPIDSVILAASECGYDLLPANRNLAGAEVELVTFTRREYRLKDALAIISDKYDVILIDCPPALSLLTLNGLAAADYVLVPMQCEYYALEGLADLLNTVQKLKQGINPNLELLGLIRTMFDKRSNLANQVSGQLQQHFNEKVFKTYIPRNIRLAEAPGFGKTAVSFDSYAAGSKAYQELTKELLGRI